MAPEPQHQGKRPKSRNDKDGVKWPFYLDIRKHLRKGRLLSACNTSLSATREPYRGSDLEAYVETINISCLSTFMMCICSIGAMSNLRVEALGMAPDVTKVCAIKNGPKAFTRSGAFE